MSDFWTVLGVTCLTALGLLPFVMLAVMDAKDNAWWAEEQRQWYAKQRASRLRDAKRAAGVEGGGWVLQQDADGVNMLVNTDTGEAVEVHDD